MQAHFQMFWHSFLSSYAMEEFDIQMYLVKNLTSLESATLANWCNNLYFPYINFILVSKPQLTEL